MQPITFQMNSDLNQISVTASIVRFTASFVVAFRFLKIVKKVMHDIITAW